MNISRRSLGKSSVAFSGLAGLAACGVVTDTNGTVTVNLANAQAEANTVYTALAAEVPVFDKFLSTADQSKVTGYLGDLKTAVSFFTALPSSTTSYAQDAQAVVSLVSEILPIVSPGLGTATVLALQAGSALISGLLSGAISVKAPPKPLPGFKATPIVAGPIPVPLT